MQGSSTVWEKPIAEDAKYIYVGGDSLEIKKYLKSNMSYVGSTSVHNA